MIDVPEGTQRAIDKARKAIDADDEVVLMPETGNQPAGGVLAARIDGYDAKVDGKWRTGDLQGLLKKFSQRGFHVRPTNVYSSGIKGTPGGGSAAPGSSAAPA